MTKLKRPKPVYAPIRPWAPLKPKKYLPGEFASHDFSLPTTLNELIEITKNVDPAKVRIEPTYADEHNLTLSWESNEEILNPHYDSQLKAYNDEMIRYKKNLADYQIKKAEYESKIEKYNKELHTYEIQKLEMRLKRLKEK